MFPWIRAGLKTVFHSGRQTPCWRRQKHRGNKSERKGVLCLSGLTANGAFHLKPLSKGLHEHFGGRWDIWHRNLYGHTGVYRDFRKSRMWHWIADAIGALARLLERHEEKQVYLVGISTGAVVLIIAVFLFELLQNEAFQAEHFAYRALSRCGILGRNVERLRRAAARKSRTVLKVALIVPALRLKRKRDEALLTLCFVMYYIGIPLFTVLQLWFYPSLWALILLVSWMNCQVFSRIWIPSGDAIAAKEQGSDSISYRSLILVVLSCFYCGLAPMICLLTGAVGGRFAFLLLEIALLLTLLPPLMWHPVRRANGYHEVKERVDSQGYLWLPVVATSTLIPLQFLARHLIGKLRTPMIIILAGQDEVVDNVEARAILPHAEFQDEPALSHGDWNSQDQASVLQILKLWLERAHVQA